MRHELENDYDKIIVFLSYMRGGTAGPWADNKTQAYAIPGTPIPTYEQFLQEFKDTFSDPDTPGTARHKMDLLTQSSKTADEYVALFRELQLDTGYNDVALCDKFEKGLNQELVTKIHGLAQMPTNLEEWISWATKLDRQYRRLLQRKKPLPNNSKNSPRPNTHPNPQITPSYQPSSPSTSSVVPMEVDAGRKRKNIICYKCKKAGHIARNCTSTFDISAMNYEDLQSHFSKATEEPKDSAEESKKDF
jgi:hypothetical protein